MQFDAGTWWLAVLLLGGVTGLAVLAFEAELRPGGKES